MKEYECVYHKWDYYMQFGCKIWDGNYCTLKNCDCKLPCDDFVPKEEEE